MRKTSKTKRFAEGGDMPEVVVSSKRPRSIGRRFNDVADKYEKWGKDNPEAKLAADLAPFTGVVTSAADTINELRKGDYPQAGLEALGLIPGVKVASALHKVSKADKLRRGVGVAAQAYDAENWGDSRQEKNAAPKKFGKGGTTSDKARINKQNTRHGKMDMPFASLNKYAGMAKGGDVAESKKMMKKEVEFFKKKGAPKSMIKHEEAEMEGGKKPNPFAKGNPFAKAKKFAKGGGIESKGKTKGRMC